MTGSTTIGGDPPATALAEGGVLGRLGALMAGHAKEVFGVWLIVLVALGAAAPSVFSSLAGAGWQANGSESVQVRELAQQHFGGNSSAAVQVVVHPRCRWSCTRTPRESTARRCSRPWRMSGPSLRATHGSVT